MNEEVRKVNILHVEEEMTHRFDQTMNITLDKVWPGVSKLDLFRKLEMPKDESRRRVKERLRPYVKVSPPRVVLLNFSVFHHFCCRIILLVI